MMLLRSLRSLCLAGLMLCAGACTYLTPYRLEIQQGHVMTDEALAKLRSGMTKNQVSQVLGTPLLNDTFHANRWDYVHYVRRRGNMIDQKHMALIFEDEKLARLDGSGAPALAPAEPMPEPVAPKAAPAETVPEPVVPKADVDAPTKPPVTEEPKAPEVK